MTDEEIKTQVSKYEAEQAQERIDLALETIMVYLHEHTKGPSEAATAVIGVIGNLYHYGVPKELFLTGIEKVVEAVDRVNAGDDTTGVVAKSFEEAKALRRERAGRGKA